MAASLADQLVVMPAGEKADRMVGLLDELRASTLDGQMVDCWVSWMVAAKADYWAA